MYGTEKQQRDERFLALIDAGKTVRDAAKEIGFSQAVGYALKAARRKTDEPRMTAAVLDLPEGRFTLTRPAAALGPESAKLLAGWLAAMTKDG